MQKLPKSSGEAEPPKRAETKSLGFTLIELLVAVAIIGILSSLVFANLNTGKKQQDIRRAAQKLMLDIRKAQNLSLSPLSSNVCVYGIRIARPTVYVIYHTNNDLNGNCPGHLFILGSSIIDSSGSTDNNVIMSPTMQDIAFQAPEPITYINGATSTALTITLSNTSCPACTAKNVIINRFGQVEIQ